MRIILDMGGDINLPDNNGWTALHHAVYQNDENKVRFLKGHGALNLSNNRRDALTPYQMAVNSGYDNIARILK